MAVAFTKQPSSRPIVYQNVTMPTPIQTVCSAKFGNSTQHIRVLSSIAGWVSIDQSTSSTVVTSATIPGAGFFIPAATFTGEYFHVTPGQVLTFCTTGLTTGYISVTEMG